MFTLTASDMSEKLRVLRMKAGFTQEKLAEFLWTTESTISKVENGHQVPDAVMYENWIWVCTHQVVRFTYIHNGRSKQHA